MAASEGCLAEMVVKLQVSLERGVVEALLGAGLVVDRPDQQWLELLEISGASFPA
jgi:hypothetical protein